MISNEEKKLYLGDLFRHLDGIAIVNVAYLLHSKGIAKYLLSKSKHTLDDLCLKFNAKCGYLNVALRLLASQGWLVYEVDNSTATVTITLNENSEAAFSLFQNYKTASEFLKVSRFFHPKKSTTVDLYKMYKILQSIQEQINLSDTSSLEYQVKKHIEGAVVGPLTVALAMNGFFHKYFMEASFTADEYHEDPESFTKILDFYTFLGWFIKKDNSYKFTEKGLFFAKRASAYGVTVSYIPTFNNLEDLLFGDYSSMRSSSKNQTEIHVDRAMNVWGSGGAHANYFKQIDDIIIQIFNRPIEEQPKGILDMGCGNGAFLIHLFDVIEQRTSRGKVLDEYPLLLVGVDFNKEALKVTRANLVNADVWAKVIWGDIGNPELLEKDLIENYDIHLSDLLNVRTFLDHNRIWSEPHNHINTQNSSSTGAFAYLGKKLSNNNVEQNLKEHLLKWKPFIQKFGLLTIELHTIPPDIAAKNIGNTAITAYDATHGFSDQYIVEIEVFLKVLKEIGLKSEKKYFSKYPDSEIATVSIQYITDKSGK